MKKLLMVFGILIVIMVVVFSLKNCKSSNNNSGKIQTEHLTVEGAEKLMKLTFNDSTRGYDRIEMDKNTKVAISIADRKVIDHKEYLLYRLSIYYVDDSGTSFRIDYDFTSEGFTGTFDNMFSYHLNSFLVTGGIVDGKDKTYPYLYGIGLNQYNIRYFTFTYENSKFSKFEYVAYDAEKSIQESSASGIEQYVTDAIYTFKYFLNNKSIPQIFK